MSLNSQCSKNPILDQKRMALQYNFMVLRSAMKMRIIMAVILKIVVICVFVASSAYAVLWDYAN